MEDSADYRKEVRMEIAQIKDNLGTIRTTVAENAKVMQSHIDDCGRRYHTLEENSKERHKTLRASMETCYNNIDGKLTSAVNGLTWWVRAITGGVGAIALALIINAILKALG